MIWPFFSIGTYIFPIGSFIFLSLFFLLGWHGYISTFIWHNLCRPMLIGYCSIWRSILNLFVLHFAHKSLILAMATEWCYVLLRIWYSFVDPCNYLCLFSLVSCYLKVLSFYLVTLYLWTLRYNDKGNCRLAYRKEIIVLHLKKYYFWGTLHVYIISSWTIFIWNLLILSDSGIYMKSVDVILC